ncbi:unnamed protein product [Bursaphelenchus xylophilus]|uniref:(pine wood nematode) hypothetical protein n=1 Tax=Bursaphelenchus xylophilus TaxID=6326 RepID=A0A1I7S0Y5_BURXY|nr:unnamed protein product [Bursaphelenchus xylophilus]CAG9087887.1 unnamed protein product [Bursaphelenchus xylophilus]
MEDEHNEHPIFTVEKLVGVKMQKGVRYYNVKWSGFGTEENTWEPENSFIDRTPIETFERQRALAALRKQRANKKKFGAKFATASTDTSGSSSSGEKKMKSTPETSGLKLRSASSKRKQESSTSSKMSEEPYPEGFEEATPVVTSSGRLTKPTLKLREQTPIDTKQRKGMAPRKTTPSLDVSVESRPGSRLTRHQVKEALKPMLEKEREERMKYLAAKTIEIEEHYHQTYPKKCYLGSKNTPEVVAKFSFPDLITHEEMCARDVERENRRVAYEAEKKRREEIRRKQVEISEQLILHQEKKMAEQVEDILNRVDLSFTKSPEQFLMCQPGYQCLEVMLVLKRELGVAVIVQLKHRSNLVIECVTIEVAMEKCPVQLKDYMNGMVLDGNRNLRIRRDESEGFFDQKRAEDAAKVVDEKTEEKAELSTNEALECLESSMAQTVDESADITLDPSMDFTMNSSINPTINSTIPESMNCTGIADESMEISQQTEYTIASTEEDLVDNFATDIIREEKLIEAPKIIAEPERFISEPSKSFDLTSTTQPADETIDETFESENLENTQDSSMNARYIDENLITEAELLGYKTDISERSMDFVAMEQ